MFEKFLICDLTGSPKFFFIDRENLEIWIMLKCSRYQPTISTMPSELRGDTFFLWRRQPEFDSKHAGALTIILIILQYTG